MLVVPPEKWLTAGGVQTLSRDEALAAVVNNTFNCFSLPPNVQSALLLRDPSGVSLVFSGVEMVVFGAVLAPVEQPTLFFAVDADPNQKISSATLSQALVQGNPCDGVLLHLGPDEIDPAKARAGFHSFIMSIDQQSSVLIFNATITEDSDVSASAPASSSASTTSAPSVSSLPPTAPASQSHRPSAAIIALLIFTLVNTLAILGALIWFLQRRARRRKQGSKPLQDSPSIRPFVRQADTESGISPDTNVSEVVSPYPVSVAVADSSKQQQLVSAAGLASTSAAPGIREKQRVFNPPTGPVSESEVGSSSAGVSNDSEQEAQVGAAIREAAEGAGLSVQAVLASLNRVQPETPQGAFPPGYDGASSSGEPVRRRANRI